MAIRVNSNTPQQQQASAQSFGAIRSYRSPFEGVQMQSVGGGFRQAAQAVLDINSSMQRKRDLVGEATAKDAATNYDLALQNANAALAKAHTTENPTLIDKARAEFDALNPEAKTFSLSTFADKEVDKKYYDLYTKPIRLGYNRFKIGHDNYANEVDLLNRQDNKLKQREKDFAGLAKKEEISGSEFVTYIDNLIQDGISAELNGFSDPSTKQNYQKMFSDKVRRAYKLLFSKAKTVEELNEQRRIFYDEIETGQLGEFFAHEEEVANLYNTRLTALTANGNNAQIANVKSVLVTARNNFDGLLNNFENFDLRSNWMGYLEEAEKQISSIPTDENGAPLYIDNATDLQNFYSTRALLGYFTPLGPSGETLIREHTIQYSKTGVLPTMPDIIKSNDAKKYTDLVAELGDNLKEAIKYGDSAEAFELLHGKANNASEVNEFIEEEFGQTRITSISHIDTSFPSNWQDNPDMLFNHLEEVFTDNTIGKVLNHVQSSLQRDNKDDISYEEASVYDLVARGMIHNGIDGSDPLQVQGYLKEKVTMLTGLYADGKLVGDQGEAKDIYDGILSVNNLQDEKYQTELLKKLNDPDVQRQPGLISFYQTLVKGLAFRIQEADLPFFDILKDERKFYNYFVEKEAELFSDMAGVTTTTKNGTKVLVFGDYINQTQTLRKRVNPFGLHAPKRLLTGLREFKNVFGRTKGISDMFTEKHMASDIGEEILRAVSFELSNMDTAYRQDIKFEELAADDPLLKYKIQDKVFKEYQRGDLDQEDKYLGYLNSRTTSAGGISVPSLKLDRIGEDENGNLGIVVEYYDVDSPENYETYIKPNGEPLVISFERLSKLVNVSLEKKFEPMILMASPTRALLPVVSDRGHYNLMNNLE